MTDLNQWFARAVRGKNFKALMVGKSKMLKYSEAPPAFWSAHPKHAWPAMILVIALLLAGTIAFNIGIFVFFSRTLSGAAVVGFDVTKVTIDRSILESVVKTLDERDARFQTVLNAPIVGDPSL